MIRFLLLGLFTTTLGFAQLNDNDRQELLQKNILANAGFESGKQRWTASSGTFTAVTSGVGTGKGAVTWDSSGSSQTLTSTAVTLPSGFYGKNGVASCAIKTTSGSATHTIQAYDGTNILASQTITSSTSAFARTSVNFIMPSSGSISLRLVSVASNEPEVTIDDCFLGLAEGFNVGDVSQATLVGTLKYAATANCIWGSTSTSFANFSADTDCPTPSTTGNATAPGTKIPAVVFNNLAPGNYQVVIQGRNLADTAAEACAYRISDGTNASGNTVAFSNGGATGTGLGLVGSFSYTSAQSSVTFQVQTSRFSGSGTCYVSIDNTAGGDYEIFVYKFPTATEQAYRPEVRDLSGTLTYAGTTNCAWNTNSSTFANFAADTDCPSASVSGIVSEPGTKIPGFNVSNLPAGKYLVTAQARGGSVTGSNTLCDYRISDGTNSSGFSGVYVDGAINVNGALSLSGVFNYTSLQSSLTFQLQGSEPLSSAGSCNINNDTSTDSLQFQIIPLSPAIQTPLLVGSVTSNSTGAERIERARVTSICTSNPCTISSQSGNWLTSIGWTTTGSYQLNIASGIFSATPSCSIVGAASGTAGVYTDDNFGTTSATTYQFRFGRTDTFAAINTSFNIICIGPR